MILIFNNGYPDYVGYRQLFLGNGTGPASYVTGGDPTTLQNNRRFIDVLFDGSTLSGKYTIKGQAVSIGERGVWKAKWMYADGSSGSGVTSVSVTTAGSGMTPGTYALSFSGGGGTGAAGTITVTSSTVTNINLTSYGVGYTSVPTVTATTGGTAPIMTAILGSLVGSQVAAGTNLSGETAVLGGYCGQW